MEQSTGEKLMKLIRLVEWKIENVSGSLDTKLHEQDDLEQSYTILAKHEDNQLKPKDLAQANTIWSRFSHFIKYITGSL